MGNHHEELGLKRISSASQFTMSDMAGMSPDPAGDYPDTKSSERNQACCTPDFAYPLVSSISFPSLSSISLCRPQLYHHRKNTKLHWQKKIHSVCMRVDALYQSCPKYPGGRLVSTQRRFHTSCCISCSNRSVLIPSRSVGLLF